MPFQCQLLENRLMQMVPVIKSSDLDRSVRFYTEVLDFEPSGPNTPTAKQLMGSRT